MEPLIVVEDLKPNLTRWDPVRCRASACGIACDLPRVAELNFLFETVMLNPGVKVVVPPDLDELLHEALLQDGLPYQLALMAWRKFHHVFVNNGKDESAARFPAGTTYGSAEVDGYRLLPGHDRSEVFKVPGCVVWCD